MIVTIPTVYVYNVKTITRETKQVGDVKDRWIGNENTDAEEHFSRYIKKELML